MMRPCAVTHSMDMDQRGDLALREPGRGCAERSGGRNIHVHVAERPLARAARSVHAVLPQRRGVPSLASFVLLTATAGGKNGSGGGGASYPTVHLGTYENGTIVQSVFDGDIVVDKIDQHCNVSLESRHGSITIIEKCDQHCWVSLKAKDGQHRPEDRPTLHGADRVRRRRQHRPEDRRQLRRDDHNERRVHLHRPEGRWRQRHDPDRAEPHDHHRAEG